VHVWGFCGDASCEDFVCTALCLVRLLFIVERNFQIRRTAVDFGVPLLTNIKLVSMFADAITQHKQVTFLSVLLIASVKPGNYSGCISPFCIQKPRVGLVPQSLADHYRAEKNSEAWTSPTEFH
jgi:carbamoyl-phosphate synthase (ammonia)